MQESRPEWCKTSWRLEAGCGYGGKGCWPAGIRHLENRWQQEQDVRGRGLVKESRPDWLEARLEAGSRCGGKDVDLPEEDILRRRGGGEGCE